MATSTEEARRKVIAAREALGGELDELTLAARSAADIPSKIKKNPLETAALAAGAGFLIVGGPKRLLQAAGSRLRPAGKRRPHEGLLPREIGRVVKKNAGPHAPEVQAGLEDDFARYLQRRGDAVKSEPGPAKSLWKTYDAVVAPLAALLAKQLGTRLVGAEPDRPRAGQEGQERPGAVMTDAPAGGHTPRRPGGPTGPSGLGAAFRRGTGRG